ncbi:MAG: tail fiber domain-containing protein, partial [Bacteroidota bacterium]
KITNISDNGTRLTFGNSVDRNFWYIDGSIGDPYMSFGHHRNSDREIFAIAPFADDKQGGTLDVKGRMLLYSRNNIFGLSLTEFLSGELPFSGSYYSFYNIMDGNSFTSSSSIDMIGSYNWVSGKRGKVSLAVGVQGVALDGLNGTYGIWGKAEAAKFDYAVYADGNVFSTGSYLPSDRRLKKNIQPLKKGLEKVMALRPSSFQYDKQSRQHMSLPEGEQYGLIAQDVEALLPQLTKTSYHAYSTGDSTALHEGFEFTAVNYVGLIPFLISATQEQQELLTKQERIIEELRSRMTQLEELVITLSSQDQSE